MKENDVFKFRYNDAYSNGRSNTDLYWCFDGQLIVKKLSDGSLYLQDTYWHGSDNRTFTLEEANKRGTLTFVCNLDEVEKINEDDMHLYEESEVFNISTQHGCHKRFVKKVGANKSHNKMLARAQHLLREAENDIDSAGRRMNRIQEVIQRLNSGEIMERVACVCW